APYCPPPRLPPRPILPPPPLSPTLRHGIVASVVKSDRPNTLLLRQKRLCSQNPIDTREAGSCLQASCSFYTSRLAGEKVCRDVLLVDAGPRRDSHCYRGWQFACRDPPAHRPP
ncbi:unnamed protein product, partial [Sphagnum compactum]